MICSSLSRFFTSNLHPGGTIKAGATQNRGDVAATRPAIFQRRTDRSVTPASRTGSRTLCPYGSMSKYFGQRCSIFALRIPPITEKLAPQPWVR
jgi:hypothetical protein